MTSNKCKILEYLKSILKTLALDATLPCFTSSPKEQIPGKQRQYFCSFIHCTVSKNRKHSMSSKYLSWYAVLWHDLVNFTIQIVQTCSVNSQRRKYSFQKAHYFNASFLNYEVLKRYTWLVRKWWVHSAIYSWQFWSYDHISIRNPLLFHIQTWHFHFSLLTQVAY